ncbi:MAG TPA: DUF1735 domain-containing protein [Parafilimonas sp.]|nr:DUF1735 domain-containing protein [Parafilimonas sp.]
MRFFKFYILIAFLTAFFSCKKDSDSVTITPNFYIINGNVADSAKTLILFASSDTAIYNVVISSTYYLSSKALVTLGVSDEARVAYNSRFNKNYELMPAGSYSFKDTTTFTTSFVIDTIPVSIYRHALSADKEYMLPIKILDASGNKIDTANSIIYLHTVSNPFAGIYNSSGTKTLYNGNASDSSVDTTINFSLVKSLIPAGIATSEIDYADLGANGWKYILKISPETGLFSVEANTVILNSVQPDSFEVLSSTFDPVTKVVYIKTSYKNLSGNERIVEESLTLH